MRVVGTIKKRYVGTTAPVVHIMVRRVRTEPTMDKKPVPTLTSEQRAYVADTNRSVAARIKFLSGEGFSRADIARAMSVHSGKAVSYQWVKNVLDKVTTAESGS